MQDTVRFESQIPECSDGSIIEDFVTGSSLDLDGADRPDRCIYVQNENATAGQALRLRLAG